MIEDYPAQKIWDSESPKSAQIFVLVLLKVSLMLRREAEEADTELLPPVWL